MGLPLFVAPVESDLNSKSDKAAAPDRPAQSRSAIRRSRRPDDREVRSMRRRAAVLRATFPTSGPDAPVSDRTTAPARTARDARDAWAASATLRHAVPVDPAARFPWIESGQLPPRAAYGRGPQLEAFERIFRSQQTLVDGNGNSFSESDHETLLRRPRERRRSRSSRQGNVDPEDEAAESRSYRRSNIAPSVAARFDRSPDPVFVVSVDPSATTRRQREEDRRRLRVRGPQVDGLGDRNRSLSPEVWDTLLTTLTPDPQPPSAGSSFASVAASSSAVNSQSQSAGASSRTSFAEHNLVDGPLLDQPCETGDLSDSDSEPFHSRTSVQPDHLSLNVPSRYRRFVSSLDSNEASNTSYVRADHADRPTLPFNGRPDGIWSSIDAIRARMRYLRDEEDAARARARARMASLSGAESATEQQLTTSATTREGSEDVPDSLDQGDLEPESGNNLDLALGGMQRIVRGLVERRDIPDEWWAEAGLSRLISDNS